MYLFLTTMPFIVAIILFAALTRQTIRAERAEAALARIEDTVAECQRAAEIEMNSKPSGAAAILADFRARMWARDGGSL